MNDPAERVVICGGAANPPTGQIGVTKITLVVVASAFVIVVFEAEIETTSDALGLIPEEVAVEPSQKGYVFGTWDIYL